MSHLTEFSHMLAYVKGRLEDKVESGSEKYRHHGRFGGTEVDFPLPGIPSLAQVEEFYLGLYAEVQGSQLQLERKEIYRRFAAAACLAYRAAWESQPQQATVYHLQECLSYVIKALRLMEKSKEWDDGHPVHWDEVYRHECAQDTTAPEEHWLLFKLKSLRPVLQLSVLILRLFLPDCPETWDEWEDSLRHKEWLQQFILDSRVPSQERIPLHGPRRADVIGRHTLETV